MAPIGPFVAIIKSKTLFDSDDSQKMVCSQDGIADSPGTNVLPFDRQGFAEGFVSFFTLYGVYSVAVRFAPNRAIV